jgi:undecaprenyl pyrophosphate phosphatase UppP
MLGLHREAGARFSFLLSMPVIAGRVVSLSDDLALLGKRHFGGANA